MEKERSNLGFGDELDELDPKAWHPPASKVSNDRSDKTETLAAAKAAGFQSRPAAPAAPRRGQRRRLTGRNTQFNMKARHDVIDAYCKVADAMGWGLGETLEKAVPLLEREYLDKGKK